MHISLEGATWLKKYRSPGSRHVSAYRNGQLAISAAILRSFGLNPEERNTFRAARSPKGDLIIQFIPQSEVNPESGSTWASTGSVTSFNVITQMGASWDGGVRYNFDVDQDQKSLIIYAGSQYQYRPNQQRIR